MELKCPYCEGTILPEHINPHRNTAKCKLCHSTHKASNLEYLDPQKSESGLPSLSLIEIKEGAKLREVFLKGEAWFDVEKDKNNRPLVDIKMKLELVK